MQHIPNDRGVMLGVHGLLGERDGAVRVSPTVRPRGQSPAERGVLLEGA
jgi:hypothetical protein